MPGILDSRYYRPTMFAQFWLVWHWLGQGPAMFHLANVVLHALATGLVAVLALRLTKDRGAALVAALLFALHPVHSEPVCWIGCSGDLLAAIFAMLAYLWRERPWLAAFCLFMALTSKEVALTVVAVGSLELLLQGRRRQALLTALGGAGVLAVYLGLRLLATFQAGPTHALFSFSRLYCFEIFSRYLAMLVWPGPLDLQHGPEFLGLPGPGRVLAYAVVCLIYLAVLLLAIRRHWQIPAFCLLWVGITLLPACNLIPVPLPLGERSTYLASVGSCCLFGWALTRRRFLAPVALLLILPLYAYRLGARVPDWCDEVRLWNSSVVRHPDNYEPLRGLAANLLLQGSYRESEALYARMFPVVPDDPDNRMGLARALMGQKRWGPAGALLAAIPPSPAMGQCLFHLGRYQDALRVWEALPSSPDVRLYTGLTWERLGDPARARVAVEGLDQPRAALLRARLAGTP